MDARVTRRLLVSGHVQGVGMRAWVERQATRRGLDGWVRNRHDGRVEALFSGPPQQVQEMIDACRSGPPLARVERAVESEESEATAAGFRQRPTV